MQIKLDAFHQLSQLTTEEQCESLVSKINNVINDYAIEFVQDLTHISMAANFSGNLSVLRVECLKDNLFRCHYGYDWSIAWTCSGTQESGRVEEKVRFTVNPDGVLDFKFLKLDV
jgi:hypothetical protein